MTPDILRTTISYNHETGQLIWLARPTTMFPSEREAKRWNARYAGKPALTARNSQGRNVGKVLGVALQAHRVAWTIFYGEWPADDIDHINGNPNDNSIANLRVVSHAENMKNCKLRADNGSGHAGVNWHSSHGKWSAAIQIDGKRHHLGYFSSKDAAISARQDAQAKSSFHKNHGQQRSTEANRRAEMRLT